VKIVREMAYQDGADDFRPITFMDFKNPDGLLHVGDGSDEEPFVVGITTRALLTRLDRDPSTFIFHIDTTFKLSQVGYSVLVMGISDRSRSFHLVAFCILSQRIESVYTAALSAFRAIYTGTTGKQIRLKFVMGDAESGQLTALEQVFRHDSDFMFLMCFFHVMKKVQEKTKCLLDRVANGVLAQIYDMHFCSSFPELVQATNCYWKDDLEAFAAYFKSQWLGARFSRWQCCYAAPGFANTDNPVEQFN
ncbi:hypothetical protein PHYSODRAFT_379541, partial [Phytophthora sojae]